jgi:predicted amidohydrolase
MLYNWAAEHPEQVQCVGGIYPVCTPVSYPGLDKAAPAFGMTPEQFRERLAEHNPIDRLAPLAKARVPILHLHGDVDMLVPLAPNSGALIDRYRALGGPGELEVIYGKGHEEVAEFFESPRLLEFFVRHGASRIVRVGAVQMRGVPGGIEANLAKADKLIREAAGQGARYILLPELYALFPIAIWAKTVDEVRAEAQTVPGPLTEHMTALARELNVFIAFGMIEIRDDKMFNTAVFLGPDGISDTYSKRCMVTHEGLRKLAEKRSGKAAPEPAGPLGPDEEDLFTKGTTDGLVRWGDLTVGTLICADGGFDGWWRQLAEGGAQLFAFPVANSGGPLLDPPEPHEIARKYGIPMIFANHLPDQPLHIGNSQVIGAAGGIAAKSVSVPDTVVVADVRIMPSRKGPRPWNSSVEQAGIARAVTAAYARPVPSGPYSLPADHVLRLVSIAPEPTYTAMLAMRDNGWLGSDVGESVALSDDRLLWLFGDTFVGSRQNGIRVKGARMINNSIAIQDRKKAPPDCVTFYWKQNHGRPASFFPHQEGTPGGYYWPTAAVLLRGELFVYAWCFSNEQGRGWKGHGTVLIRVSNPHDPPDQWVQKVFPLELPNDSSFHTAVYVEDPYVYFYGLVRPYPLLGIRQTALARARIDDLLRGGLAEVYQYWVNGPQGPHWSDQCVNCVPQFSPPNTECVVHYEPEWDLYTCFTYRVGGSSIYLTTAREVTGPWSQPVPIYSMPEHGNFSFVVLCYAVRQHPELSTKPGEVILSYATNAIGGVKPLFTEEGKDVYVHRFLRVQLELNAKRTAVKK